MENEKYLFVVSGAAGTGKDSVVSALRKAHPEIEKTVSATTRSPRPGEQEGVDYYYRTKEQFQQLIDQDEVVEHNFFNGNYYGTLKEEVNRRLNAGKLVVMVIDVHGAANIRRMYPGATTIFLLPPSTQELERRLRPYLEKSCREHGLSMMFFMLTNIIEESTRLMCYGESADMLVEDAFGRAPKAGTIWLKGVVSRKKQLIPAFIDAISKEAGGGV